MAFYDQLRRNLVQAKSSENMHLTVLTDAAGHKMAQKLYHQFCSQEDYSKFPAFMQDLDRLMSKYAGGKDEFVDDESAEGGDGDKGKDKPEDNRDKF